MGKCELCGEVHQKTMEVFNYVAAPEGPIAVPYLICSECNEEILASMVPVLSFPESF